MAKKQIDPAIAKVLKAHGLGHEACWDCHGTWVVYHWALERVALSAGITFDPPQIIEANGREKCAAMAVMGTLGDKSWWSIGEAAPGNNKNAYPYAMAEKRAKDRVILKLIGLHGLAYSETEADEFERGKNKVWGDVPKEGAPGETGPVIGKLPSSKLQEELRKFAGEMMMIENHAPGASDQFIALQQAYKPVLLQCEQDLPAWYYGKQGSDTKGLHQRIAEKTEGIAKHEREHMDMPPDADHPGSYLDA